MPKGGLEPPRVASHGPQPCASASSATSASCVDSKPETLDYKSSKTSFRLWVGTLTSCRIRQAKNSTQKPYFGFGVGLVVWLLPGDFAFEFIEVVPDELLVAGEDEVAGTGAAGEGC